MANYQRNGDVQEPAGDVSSFMQKSMFYRSDVERASTPFRSNLPAPAPGGNITRRAPSPAKSQARKWMMPNGADRGINLRRSPSPSRSPVKMWRMQDGSGVTVSGAANPLRSVSPVDTGKYEIQ
jgi:hypothetical protein